MFAISPINIITNTDVGKEPIYDQTALMWRISIQKSKIDIPTVNTRKTLQSTVKRRVLIFDIFGKVKKKRDIGRCRCMVFLYGAPLLLRRLFRLEFQGHHRPGFLHRALPRWGFRDRHRLEFRRRYLSWEIPRPSEILLLSWITRGKKNIYSISNFSINMNYFKIL